VIIREGGKADPPYTLEKARSYLSAGFLAPEMPAQYEGLDRWLTLGKIMAYAEGREVDIPGYRESKNGNALPLKQHIKQPTGINYPTQLRSNDNIPYHRYLSRINVRSLIEANQLYEGVGLQLFSSGD